MVQVDDSHFCNYPMYYILAFSRSPWNLKSRNDRHRLTHPRTNGSGPGRSQQKQAPNFQLKEKDEFHHFPVRGKICIFSIASESKTVFSSRVMRHGTLLKTGVASLQNMPIYAHKKSVSAKCWFSPFCGNGILPFYHRKMKHIWAAFAVLHHSAL